VFNKNDLHNYPQVALKCDSNSLIILVTGIVAVSQQTDVVYNVGSYYMYTYFLKNRFSVGLMLLNCTKMATNRKSS